MGGLGRNFGGHTNRSVKDDVEGTGGAGMKPTLLPLNAGSLTKMEEVRGEIEGRDIGLHFGHVKLKVQMSHQRKDVEGDVGFLILELRKKRSRLKK